ncbi:MAG TPA: homoserine kinase [Vicinamibacterales bacterium]
MRDQSHLEAVEAFAPATVANVACGFDVLGFALAEPGDRVVARRRQRPGLEIVAITGDERRLSLELSRNTAGVAAGALVAALGVRDGIDLMLHKGLPLSSGLGGSAASAVAAVVAVDALLGGRTSPDVLLRCAIEGERLASGSAHADNVAPALLGGFVLARTAEPPDIVRLPVPAGLACAVVHPRLEVETAAARRLLGDMVPLRSAIQQWANLGALVAGLHQGDLSLIGRALQDVVAEPKRAVLVPGFGAAKQAALAAGALGCSLSGSGPSLFALCDGTARALTIARAMQAVLQQETGVEVDTWVSPVGAAGARAHQVPNPSCAT